MLPLELGVLKGFNGVPMQSIIHHTQFVVVVIHTYILHNLYLKVFYTSFVFFCYYKVQQNKTEHRVSTVVDLEQSKGSQLNKGQGGNEKHKMERTWENNNNKNQKFSNKPCININLKPKTKEETFKIRLIKFKEEQFFSEGQRSISTMFI